MGKKRLEFEAGAGGRNPKQVNVIPCLPASPQLLLQSQQLRQGEIPAADHPWARACKVQQRVTLFSVGDMLVLTPILQKSLAGCLGIA